MRKLAFISVALMVVACGNMAGGRTSLTEGPLPSRNTEIGRVAQGTAFYCGSLGFVDLGSAVDGPSYYFRRHDGVIVGRCGGYCMADANHSCQRACPPAGWSCGNLPERAFRR
jgi:hypothetical protein